jgi:hypothetical protein
MAGASQIDCWNLALSYLDLSQTIASVTDQTPQARYCNQFWDRARKIVLEQCYWTFATKAVALALLLDQSTLTSTAQIIYPGWRYVYSRPNDCLKAQSVTTQWGLRQYPYLSYFWTNPSAVGQYWGPFRPPWTEMLDQITQPVGNSIDILTDQDSAWLVYTTDLPNLAIASETFVDCCAWQLATLIAGPASANQKAKEMVYKMAPLSLSRALAQNLNEQQPDPYPQSPSIQARL